MGAKRAYDEDLQEFIKHPKHLNYGLKPSSVAENKLCNNYPQSENVITVPDTVIKEFEISAKLPLVIGEDDFGPAPVFSTNVFSDFFQNNFPSRQLFNYDDIYSSLLNRSLRKEIPIGPNHQADIPEFDPEIAKNYIKNREMERFLGVCVILFNDSTFEDSSSDIQPNCDCLDGGSIRCVQQHVKESRLKLKKHYGDEKFIDLGMLDMGEEVSGRWCEEEEISFHEIVYSNPAYLGGNFWKQLSVAFPSRTMKELVSYYFNVFILYRRSVQNRSCFLDIDSDDDECRESYGGQFGNSVEDGDFVVGDHEEDQSLEPKSCKKVDVNSSVKCSIVEDILGCSENGKNAI